MKCPECGKFLKNIEVVTNGLQEVLSVQGDCKEHGAVNPTDWDYDDIFEEAKE